MLYALFAYTPHIRFDKVVFIRNLGTDRIAVGFNTPAEQQWVRVPCQEPVADLLQPADVFLLRERDG